MSALKTGIHCEARNVNMSEPAKKKIKTDPKKYQFGNYDRYYGYRNKGCLESRLDVLDKAWFEGKSVLDIGCNAGQVTLAIAENFGPATIRGIDIDPNLIKRARKNIKVDNSSLPSCTARELTTSPPKSEISFKNENYVLGSDDKLENLKPQFDCIMCLSVSKWVHLNWGDDGLKRMFKRVYAELNLGGRFIFEPQPWSSYEKKLNRLTDRIRNNYKSIIFKPEMFEEYLLSSEIGFKRGLELKPPTESKGFNNRPIYLFIKPGTDI
ncbi:putative RNA methyltransferase Y17G7B.18 [Halotydeus destructor]|nr:putative RNA methyltransferase Y17G7B.18 [Halotydeus destructor]